MRSPSTSRRDICLDLKTETIERFDTRQLSDICRPLPYRAAFKACNACAPKKRRHSNQSGESIVPYSYGFCFFQHTHKFEKNLKTNIFAMSKSIKKTPVYTLKRRQAFAIRSPIEIRHSPAQTLRSINNYNQSKSSYSPCIFYTKIFSNILKCICTIVQ